MLSNSHAAAVACALTLLSCSGGSTRPPATQPPTAGTVTVTNIDVGRSLGADKAIADKTMTFAPTDTFYVAVNTAGSASVTLAARFTFGDQLVTESTQTIMPNGPAVTEFHASKGDPGWPKGDYKVEILLNGASAGTKTFKVQ